MSECYFSVERAQRAIKEIMNVKPLLRNESYLDALNEIIRLNGVVEEMRENGGRTAFDDGYVSHCTKCGTKLRPVYNAVEWQCPECE